MLAYFLIVEVFEIFSLHYDGVGALTGIDSCGHTGELAVLEEYGRAGSTVGSALLDFECIAAAVLAHLGLEDGGFDCLLELFGSALNARGITYGVERTLTGLELAFEAVFDSEIRLALIGRYVGVEAENGYVDILGGRSGDSGGAPFR